MFAMGPAFFSAQSAVATGPSQTSMSATNKAADIVLSSSNKVAGTTSGTGGTGGIALSDTSHASGKFYAEIEVLGVSSGAAVLSAGIKLGTGFLSNYLGQASDSFGTWTQFIDGHGRDTYNNGTEANIASGPALGINAICRLAVDASAGKLWLTHFSSSSWLGGGDPALGTAPTYTFTPGSTVYLAMCPRYSGNFLGLVDPGSWANSAPSGFGVFT